jgi:signal transduction histidine kinase
VPPQRARHSDRFALRLALLYFAVAGTWIVASDRGLALVTGASWTFSLAQTGKGLGFVSITSVLLFLLVRRGYRLLQQSDYERAAAEARADALMTQALREQLPIAVWTTDRDLRITALQGSLARRVELGDLIGDRVGEALGDAREQSVAAHEAALAGHATTYVRTVFGLRIESHVEPLTDPVSGEVAGVVGIALDVSERERLELELRQAAKLEAVGRLAGGIAHDFNNLLTGILGFLGFALRSLDTHPARHDLEEAERAARRAADLTQQLLTFARREAGTPEPIDLGATLQGLLPLLNEVAGPGVVLEHEDGGACWAAIHPLPFEQVIVNLVANARDAQDGRGRILIETTTRDEGGERWSTIRVADEGDGLTDEVRAHQFEPFFTTKPVGRGTGLGLATSLATVEDAGGRIAVESEPRRGSTFTVLLPCVAAPAVRPEPAEPEPEPARTSGRRVLLVEDEEALRELFRRWLADAGHAVEVASGAEDARALLAARDFDVVVSDVTLPDGSGTDVAALARAGGTGAVLISGRTLDPELLPEGTTMLAKPFGRDDLLRALG